MIPSNDQQEVSRFRFRNFYRKYFVPRNDPGQHYHSKFKKDAEEVSDREEEEAWSVDEDEEQEEDEEQFPTSADSAEAGEAEAAAESAAQEKDREATEVFVSKTAQHPWKNLDNEDLWCVPNNISNAMYVDL